MNKKKMLKIIKDELDKHFHNDYEGGEIAEDVLNAIIKLGEGDKRDTCGFCDNPCGNDHCPVVTENENRKDKE